MARVNKEKKTEVCDWIGEQVDKMLHTPVEEGQEAPKEEQCILQAIEEAEKEFGFRAPTIRKWYEELVMKGASLGRKRKRKGPGRPPRKKSPDDPAILEEALVVIGELTLD